MPGVIVAAGRPDSERWARRAAQPMLRRPWEALALVSSERGDVTLGFAGERGGVAVEPETGVLAALDGELVGPPRTGPGAARELLALYLRDGAALDPPDGAWAAAVWDGRSDELVLLTDPCGQRPLYATRVGGALVAAGELKALVAAGLEARVDLQAWAELLAYELPVTERALLADVRTLAGGTTLVARGENDEVRRRWRFRLEPAPDGDEGELTDELGRVLERAVLDRLGDDTALALSGGLDSRCIAAVLSDGGFGGLAATYGVPGSADLRLGAEIAAHAGLRHRALPLEPGYLPRDAPEIVWLDEGRMRCFHAHHLALRALRLEHGCRSLLIGLHGDSVLRDDSPPPHAGPSREAFVAAAHGHLAQAVTDALHDKVLTPRFAGELRGRARAALTVALDGDVTSRHARWKELLWLSNSPMTDFDDHLAGRDPYTDRAVIELCRTLPVVLRRRGRLQRAYLRRFPALADVVSPKLGLPPKATGWREAAGVQVLRVRSKARATLDGLLGPGRRRDLGGLSDYAAELRTSGAGLLSLLLEPRTLERDQLGEEGVRRLIEETLSGRASHTKALGMLLTFELFQRQLVDGDGVKTA